MSTALKPLFLSALLIMAVGACSLDPDHADDAASSLSVDLRTPSFASVAEDVTAIGISVLRADAFEAAVADQDLSTENDGEYTYPEFAENEFRSLVDAREAAFVHEELDDGGSSGSLAVELVPGDYHVQVVAETDDGGDVVAYFGGSYFDWQDLDPTDIEASLTSDLSPAIRLAPGEVATHRFDLRSVAEHLVRLQRAIAVPDFGNNRIVVIRDMEGADRHVVDEESLGDITGTLAPNDLTYDQHGRLWVANDDAASPGLLRIDDTNDVSGASFDTIISGVRVSALAIDDTSDRLYYWRNDDGDAWSLQYVLLDDVGDDDPGDVAVEIMTDVELAEFLDLDDAHIRGLDVTPDGRLIAAMNDAPSGGAPYLVELFPNGADLVEIVGEMLLPADLGWTISQWDSSDDVFVRDVAVIGDRVYTTIAVNHQFEDDIAVVVRADIDLAGSAEPVTPSDDDFFGPQRFVARNFLARNEEPEDVVVTDWDGEPTDARLLTFSGADGGEWETYSDPDDPFDFFDVPVYTS